MKLSDQQKALWVGVAQQAEAQYGPAHYPPRWVRDPLGEDQRLVWTNTRNVNGSKLHHRPKPHPNKVDRHRGCACDAHVS
jgi:hypothetical protein